MIEIFMLERTPVRSLSYLPAPVFWPPNGCECCALYIPVKVYNKDKIKHDIQYRRKNEKEYRCFAVAERAAKNNGKNSHYN
jgi:hypothetical protein